MSANAAVRGPTMVKRPMQRLTVDGWRKLIVAATVALAASLAASALHAQDVTNYTRDTYESWLHKYADVKPDFKPGDVLTAKDLERLRPFIPPGYLEQLNFPEFKMEIIAPQNHAPRRDYMDCTEKYQNRD